jgi:hypothetical protein
MRSLGPSRIRSTREADLEVALEDLSQNQVWKMAATGKSGRQM